MKNKNRILALLLIASLGLAGCGSTVSVAESDALDEKTREETGDSSLEAVQEETEDGEVLAEEQVLNLLLGSNVSTLDWNNYGWVQESLIINETQEPLLRNTLDEDGNQIYEEAGAQSYEVSEDGLTYTFYLRENYWSDGVQVTAQDYVYSYVRQLTASNGFTNISDYTIIKNGQAFYNGEVTDASELGITAIDDTTLEVVLEVPDLDAITKLASSYPIREDVVEAATVEYGTNVDEMVFSGPFIVTEWITDNRMVLEKNEYYWDADSVILEQVNMVYAAEAGTQATLFDSQQIDLVEYNEDYADQWNEQAENGEIVSIVQPKGHVRWVVFNQNGPSPLTKNAKVRLAFSLAIDRQEYLDTVFGGRYYPAWDYVPFVITVDGEEYNSQDAGTIKTLQEEYDTDEKLRALLEEGLEELGIEYDDLSEVSIIYMDCATTTQDQARIEYLKQTWESRLGITVDVEIKADNTYISGDDFDLTCATWNSTTVYYALKNYGPYGKSYLAGNYEDEEILAWFEEVEGTTDPETYAEIYKKIENKLVSEAVVAPIYWGDTRYFQQSYVQGIVYFKLSSNYDFSKAYILEH